MAQPLVEQLRFTRSEWLRALRGGTEEDGIRQVLGGTNLPEFVGNLDQRAPYRPG